MRFYFFTFLIGFLINISLIRSECPEPYSHCNLGKEGFINVHIVPHTHDDVGWLKTVDQYYYGAASQYQTASVQYILDTVVSELEKDPKKRFVYVEIAFFWRWWNEQNDSTKQIVRTLVNEGRLEFVIGAWCMNDEATTYYNDIIDQQTLGLRFILKEFGECARPRSAWQIDPFGHSREQASLFAQFGFDGLFLGRVDYQDFDYRGDTKTREGLWQASANLDKKAQLFTGVLPNGYGPPPGFCFDAFCGDDPIMDNPNLEDYNVDQKVDDFIKYTLDQQTKYKTKNLIMTMGSDFQFSNAKMWFKNLDKTIKYVNERQINGSKINIFYSTTACYLYSLNKANATWNVKHDDFFPYAHKEHGFWTGYFTSRAALKFYVRKSNNILQASRQIAAMNNLKEGVSDKIFNLERAMGVAQHHDAVSGTEKQHVAYDYAKRLSIGVQNVLDFIIPKFNELTGTDLNLCQKLNISECIPIEKAEKFTGVIYNPLARPVEPWIRVPIVETSKCPAENFKVMDDQNNIINSEVVAVDSETKKIPERVSKAEREIVFKATVPSLNFAKYTFICQNKTDNIHKLEKKKNDLLMMKNEHLQLNFDNNGNLNEIINIDLDKKTKINQTFCYYNSFQGNNSEPQFQPSGAYIFRPISNKPTCLTASKYTIYQGDQFNEIHQVYNDWISQTIRLYNGKKNAEFNWQVGPIDVTNDDGKEVIMKFNSDLKSESTFYTDSNGREILKRIKDFRPTWKLKQTEQVAGNYYPINSQIFIRDEVAKTQLTLVNDRSQGGSSINEGSLELMLHRITLNDDSLGVGEPLNEQGSDGKGLVVKGSVNLIFESIEKSARIHREISHEINSNPLVFFSSKNSNVELPLKVFNKVELPANLHLLTLMNDYGAEEKNVLLVRIEHFYEIGEDKEMSQVTSVCLREMFKGIFNVVGVKELALGANMPVEDLDQRLKWREETIRNSKFNKDDYLKFKSNLKATTMKNDQFSFSFKPMEIRTFHVWYA